MKAIVMTNPGSADVLALEDIPIPVPKNNEVLIKVAAAGINRPDIMQRKGMYPPPPGASEILGLEIAGTIVETGNKVTEHNSGDKVCALVTGGGYAEYCIAPAQLCLPVPRSLDLIQGAALPETFFTVWSNVFKRGELKSGNTFMVHGGTSGIGTTAIQLAKAFGAKVITTAGTDLKCDFCTQLGADLAINYRNEDFVECAKSFTDGNGVNLILDMVGGNYLQRNLSCLAVDGKLLQIALQNGPKSQINLLPVMLKRLTLTGSTLRARSVAIKYEIAGDLLQNVWPLLENNSVKPIIHTTFPLSQASNAHRLMESSQHIGKIILTL